MRHMHLAFAGLSLSFESPVALIVTPVTNMLLCEWSVSTKGNIYHSYSFVSGVTGYGP